MRLRSQATTISLGELIEIRSSLADPTDRSNRSLPHVSPEHIASGNGIIDWSSVRSCEEDRVISGKYEFVPGNILYSKIRPYLNKVAIADRSGLCSADMYALQVRDGAHDRYIYHHLQSPDFLTYAASFSNRANIPKLNREQLSGYSVPLPPFDEQRRIAAILDKADALRRQRRRALGLLDGLTRSIFLEMFGDPAANPRGYPLRSFGELAVRISDGPFGSNLKSEHYVDAGVRVVRLQNIGVGEFVDDDRAFVSEDHFSRLSRHECLPGDVLVGTLGDPNLRACIQPSWLKQALNKADCVQMRVDGREAAPQYVMVLINQPSVERMAQGSILGQTRARISMGRFRELRVPIAPISEQARFAEIVERLEHQKRRRAAEADALADLFASLQHRAFTGQL